MVVKVTQQTISKLDYFIMPLYRSRGYFIHSETNLPLPKSQ